MAAIRESQQIRYEQVMQVARAFWEWRSKLLRLVFLGVGGALAAAAWMYDHDFGRWVGAPFIFGAVLSLAFAYLDRRSGWIVGECYRVGRNIEEEWSGYSRRPRPGLANPPRADRMKCEEMGIFSVLSWSHDQPSSWKTMWRGEARTFGTLLPQLFRITSVVLLVAAAIVFWTSPRKHDSTPRGRHATANTAAATAWMSQNPVG
jgi:hypothetical protein